MSTINDPALIRELIDNNGWLADDQDRDDSQRCHRITKYVNHWGAICYGCDFRPGPTKYTPSDFVRSPQVIWSLTPEPEIQASTSTNDDHEVFECNCPLCVADRTSMRNSIS